MITILHLEMRGQLDDLRRWLQQRARQDSTWYARYVETSPELMHVAFEAAILVYCGFGVSIGKGLRRWAWAEFKRAWLREATVEDKTGKL